MRAIAIFAGLAFAVAASAEAMYPVPSGATNVRHVALQPGVYEQDHFFLAERYPGTAAIEHYAAILSQWRHCYIPDRQWESFPDASGAEHRTIHQLTRHWISPNNDAVVTLVLRYESPGLSEREVPTNDRQLVTLIRLRTANPQEHLDHLGATCTKVT